MSDQKCHNFVGSCVAGEGVRHYFIFFPGVGGGGGARDAPLLSCLIFFFSASVSFSFLAGAFGGMLAVGVLKRKEAGELTCVRCCNRVEKEDPGGNQKV